MRLVLIPTYQTELSKFLSFGDIVRFIPVELTRVTCLTITLLTNLSSQAESVSIREACATVDKYTRAVYSVLEFLCRILVFCDDSVRVSTTIGMDMLEDVIITWDKLAGHRLINY